MLQKTHINNGFFQCYCHQCSILIYKNVLCQLLKKKKKTLLKLSSFQKITDPKLKEKVKN